MERLSSSCFGIAAVFAEWARPVQRAAPDGKSFVTTPSFAIGKPFVRQPRGDARVSLEDKLRAVARHAAEVVERRAIFGANTSS